MLRVTALGLAQIVSWGSLYYSFSLFVLPMQTAFGWSLSAINGALTAALLVAGGCALPVGRWIDRHGGRGLMTTGALAAVLLLVAWSRVETLVGLYTVWMGLGACMAAVLYEPIFVVLTYHFREQARRAITTLTLVAGFASTVYMPLIELLLRQTDWRSVVLVLATIMGLVTVPLHATLIPPRPAAVPPHAAGRAARGGGAYLRARCREPAFWGLLVWFTAYNGTASALMVQLVPALKSQQVELSSILLAVALVGPSQVLGRLMLMLAGDRVPTVAAGAVTTALTPVAIAILVLGQASTSSLALFAILFGIANGVTTILRGSAPAEWLGRSHYGTLMGALGTPMMLMAAIAPLATAAIWTASGSVAVMQWAVFALAVSGMGGFWLAVLTRPASGPDRAG